MRVSWPKFLELKRRFVAQFVATLPTRSLSCQDKTIHATRLYFSFTYGQKIQVVKDQRHVEAMAVSCIAGPNADQTGQTETLNEQSSAQALPVRRCRMSLPEWTNRILHLADPDTLHHLALDTS